MKFAETSTAQLQNQIADIDDILRCTQEFPDHPLATAARPGLLAQRRALEQALASLA